MLPERIGPYRIEHRLGVGGMGEVYRARDERLDRAVAIKFVRAEALGEDEAKKRFRREAKTAAQLVHAAIVQVYDERGNRVESHGLTLPSSESMTHGGIYDLGTHIRFVFHAHSAAIWRRARELRLPTTDPAVPYGTSRRTRSRDELC